MAVVVGFSEADLRTAAGPRSFERGRSYTDAVTALEVSDGEATATVHGGDAYHVVLSCDEDGELWGDCDCPYGLDGNFCKHCVALGLVLLDRSGNLPALRAEAGARRRDLDRWLESRSQTELLALLRELLAQDDTLRRRLELRAAADDLDVASVRSRIRALLDTTAFSRHGYVEYADARGYAEQVCEAVDAIRSLTASGAAAQAVELARETIRLIAAAYGNVDDSSGHVGDAAADLGDAHLEACLAARPDPVETAGWLFSHLTGDESYLPELDAADYHDVLGEPGGSRLRALVVEAWTRNPTDWSVKYLMQELVRAEGDVDAIVAVHAADLAPHGATHLLIALELDGAGREAEALDWAERGLAATSDRPHMDEGLLDYLTARYQRDGRHRDVVALHRDRLRAERSLTAYQRLRRTAQAANCWESERTHALELLRAASTADAAGRWYGQSAWVDALLDDGDLTTVWDAVPGIASPRQLLTLADRSRATRPADALAVYLDAIEGLTGHTGDGVYRQIADLLLRARECHQLLGTTSHFGTYLTSLRTAQKRKRNLMRILDQNGL